MTLLLIECSYSHKGKNEHKGDLKKNGCDKYFHARNVGSSANKHQNQDSPKNPTKQTMFTSNKDKHYYKDFTCYRCGKMGHIGKFCDSDFPQRTNQVVSKERKSKNDEKRENAMLLLKNSFSSMSCSMVPQRSDSPNLGQRGKHCDVCKMSNESDDVGKLYSPFKGVG